MKISILFGPFTKDPTPGVNLISMIQMVLRKAFQPGYWIMIHVADHLLLRSM
jgi:hypothetical protein